MFQNKLQTYHSYWGRWFQWFQSRMELRFNQVKGCGIISNIKSKFPREVLNEIKWRKDLDLSKTKIYYTHRGAFNDTAIVLGKDIIEIGTFLEIRTEEGFQRWGVQNTCIPYHRIRKIEYDEEIIFEREMKMLKKNI